jgi:mRNA interferase RelE/StbE
MNAVFLASFLKDIKNLRDAKLRHAIEQAIKDVEQSHSIDAVRTIKRLSGHRDYYRIRLGQWRLGLKVQGATVQFIRCLHRRDVYRFFP